tara:strand:- start:6803 stop:8230 length:1428 start_codon:yes stop_codon:yes gene_type:complete
MTVVCDKNLNFQDCELAILRHAVDNAQKIVNKQKVDTPEVKKIVSIVENFLKSRQLICYGGTAINNILPKDKQFYDYTLEIPDYDFFSMYPIRHAKELVDLYVKNGYNEVEAKSGVHYGTYKVFVNFIPIADITYLHPQIYKNIKKDSKIVDKIYYAPVNFLRMSLYLELSRPAGDTSRWEKILRRITLLNTYYPVEEKVCVYSDFQRSLHNKKLKDEPIFELLKDALIENGVVFFGGYASYLYSKYMPSDVRKLFSKTPDFDVLSTDIEKTKDFVLKKLKNYDFVKAILHKKIGEIIPKHYEIIIGKDTVLFIYQTIGCHSYNKLSINKKKIKVATIDTMLSMYLAFRYADRPYFDPDRILCMSNFLYEVQQHNRLKQKGLLKRFSLDCEGTQPTLASIRAEKNEKYNELNRNDPEFERWFLKYSPARSKSKLNSKKRFHKTKKNIKNKKSKKKFNKTTKSKTIQNVFDLYRNI